ncbi:MAG: TonB-dependent receptor [bacterium]|nr:TonB-dependent receptor [bacterium]
MLAFAALLAAPTSLSAAPLPTIVVESDAGAPIAGASVDLRTVEEQANVRTDAQGRAAAPFPAPLDASVSAPGYRAAVLHITSGGTTIVTLSTDLRVIERVSVVTGSPRDLHLLPVTALSLDATAVKALAPTTADGLLSALPGFDEARSNSTVTNPTQLRASIGGAGQDRGLVLVDGLPAENGFGGWIEWPAISPLSVASVELLRDAASALYGSGAVGGVVDIRTLRPSRTAQGFAQYGIGPNGGSAQTLSLGGTVGSAATRLFVSQRFDGGYAAAPPGYRSGVDGRSASRSDDLGIAVDLPLGSARALGLSVKTFDDYQNTGRPNYNDEESGWQEALSYRAAHGGSTWQISGFTRNGTLVNNADIFPKSPGVPLYRQTIPSHDDGGGVAWSHAWAHDVLRAQTSLRVINGSYTQVSPASGALQSAGGGRQAHAALALSDEHEQGRLDVIGALRGETVSTTGSLTSAAAPAQRFSAGSPFLALRYSLTPALALHASEGVGFRAPFLNELYRGFRIAAMSFNPNPLLGAERSTTRNVGLDALLPSGRLFAELTGTRVNEAIAFVTTAANIQTRENVERTATDGYELGWEGDLGRRWSLRASYLSQYARVVNGPTRDVGNRLPFIPDREGSITAIAHWPSGVSLSLAGTLLGQTYADDLNREPLGSAILLAASLDMPLSSTLALGIHATNLANASYLTSVDRLAPPAQIWLDLRSSFGR